MKQRWRRSRQNRNHPTPTLLYENGATSSVRSCGLACEQFLLLRPVQRQIEFGQPRRSERDGLPALQDRLNQLRAQEGEANETANVAPGNAVTLGQLLERSDAAADELLKPRASPRNRLDQRRITSRAVLLR